jgi:flavin reductase (DIM6/NTAB) family NADH-FMN oxidoreductase RutF
MTPDPEQLRHAMRAWTTGVAVVTSAHNGIRYGMTVNSFTSISLDPPLISVALKKLTHTHDLVENSGEFAVTILAAHQKGLSDIFAGKHPEINDRFAGVETETLVLQPPLIKNGLAYFNCRVVNAIPVGENTLFIAAVIAARGKGEGDPLVYHNRTYWKLTPTPPVLGTPSPNPSDLRRAGKGSGG